MKKLLKIGLLAIIGFLFYGCKKQTFYPIHATISGVAFNGTSCIFEKDPNYNNTSTSVIIYGGYFSGSTTASVNVPYIGIGFGNLPATGTYEITPRSSNCQAYYIAADTTIKIAVSGEVNITFISDKIIVGNFSFVTDDGTIISDGIFAAKAAQ